MSDSEDTDASVATEWPATPVKKEWLENILMIHHGDGSLVTVNEFDVNPGCTAAESVLSDILAVSIDYNLDNEKTHLNVIVKLLPQDPFNRFFVTEAQFDLREIKFYTQVIVSPGSFFLTVVPHIGTQDS